MARRTVTTAEAALILGQDPRSFARFARRIGVQPLRRQRIGRSYVTVWSLEDLAQATQPVPA